MKKILVIPFLAAALLASGCAVKTYPRPVTAVEKSQTNYAHAVDTAGARLYARIRTGPNYDLSRQTVQVDYQYYLDPALREDPRKFYPRPEAPEVEVLETLFDSADAEVVHLRWRSQYQPQNPSFAPLYAEYPEDQVAYGVYCRSKRGNRAAVVIAHGWTQPDVAKTWKGERLLEYAAMGYDSVLVQQPYHGQRAPADSVFSGEYFITGELSRTNEAFCQAVTDVRTMVSWLLGKYATVGVKGGSLGGITTLLTAAVDDRIAFAVAWVPPSSVGDFPEDSPLVPFVIEGLRRSGLDQETVSRIAYVASPKNFQPAIDKRNILIIAGMGDNFVPPNQPTMVWEAWARPEIVWFAGGHVLNFELKDCREKEKEFMISRLPP